MASKLKPLASALARLKPNVGSALQWAAKAQALSASDLKSYSVARIAREPVIRDAISESCAEWIYRDSLPLTDRETACFLYDRFDYAYRLGDALLVNGFDSKASEEDILYWLLIGSWEEISLPRWKHDIS